MDAARSPRSRPRRRRPTPMTDPGNDRPGYHRVLLKLGGEMFGGGRVGLDPDVVQTVAEQIAEVVSTGVQVAVVIGGGNFFRGAELEEIGRASCRERVCQYVSISGVAVSLQKKNRNNTYSVYL